MKNILIFLIVVSSNLFSSYLTVSSASIGSEGTGTTLLNNFSASFPNLVVSSSNMVFNVPVYIKSDTNTDAVVTRVVTSIILYFTSNSFCYYKTFLVLSFLH